MFACFKSFFAVSELIIDSDPVPCSEASLKKAPGNKIPAATPHPGKNGTPTFAAVAAGYDKSPGKYPPGWLPGDESVDACWSAVSCVSGGSGPGKSDNQGKSLAHMPSVESDSSDRYRVKTEPDVMTEPLLQPSLSSFYIFPYYSSGLWSPIDTGSSPNFHSANSFSAFGSSNSFNLTGGNPCGFRALKRKGMLKNVSVSSWLDSACFCLCLVVFSAPKVPEPQQSWSDITSVSSSIWDVTSSDSLHSWPSSPSSPTAPTAVRACVCLPCEYFLWPCGIYRTSPLSFFFLFSSHSWETPAIPGLQPPRLGTPSGQQVQIQP